LDIGPEERQRCGLGARELAEQRFFL
jgi:hypothetical protein